MTDEEPEQFAPWNGEVQIARLLSTFSGMLKVSMDLLSSIWAVSGYLKRTTWLQGSRIQVRAPDQYFILLRSLTIPKHSLTILLGRYHGIV